MTMNTSSRQRALHTTVMLFIVFLALQAKRIFPDIEKNGLILAIVTLSSKGLYELIIMIIYRTINSSEFMLRLYWGHLYLNGIWSYTYSLNDKIHFGVWEFEQDIDGVQVIGNGLDDNFQARTIVRSVSPLIAEQGGFFVLNVRNELTNDNARVFSKTTLLLDRPRRPMALVKTMRATTEIYGGPSDRQLHPNVLFVRHTDVDNIEEVIEGIRQVHSVPHPVAVDAALPPPAVVDTSKSGPAK